jgi:hypothetical protein
MPRKSGSGSSGVTKAVAFAPLALALVMGAVSSSPTSTPPAPADLQGVTEVQGGVTLTPVACEQVQDFEDCHTRYVAGCGPTQYDAYTNLLKNQLIAPPAAAETMVTYSQLTDYDTLNQATPAGIAKGNHQAFKDQMDKIGEGQLRQLVGYLFYVKEEGAETSNCGLTGEPPEGTNVDYHIGIGFDAKLAEGVPTMNKLAAADKAAFNHSLKTNSVVVEMTPHYRALYENKVWTFENVNAVLGKQVRVVGQLMFDNEHDISSQNCYRAKTDSDRKLCWRYSVWELHPVVRFQVCATGACDATSGDWVELDGVAAGNPPPATSCPAGCTPADGSKTQPAAARPSATRSAAPQ